jgi:hypothetical protein
MCEVCITVTHKLQRRRRRTPRRRRRRRRFLHAEH